MMAAVTTTSDRPETPALRAALPQLVPFAGILAVAMILPFVSNDYWALIGTRAAIYWVLVSGLNLVVGFAGHLAIGYVALLALGAYATSVLVAGNVMPPLPVFAALPIAGCVGAVFGVIVGLPALRLRTFYFAMSTLGFATIVTQIALAWQSVTGGGIGIAGPEFPEPFNTAWGYYYLCVGFAAFCTWMSANVAHSRFGRALIAVRDAEVAAEATGISKPRMLIAIFLFAGALAAIAGGLFASLQTYITPDAFTFDLSILFFIAILIGGRGSILGPMLGTIILTILPEIAAPLAAWSTFLYAALLLAIVLAMPGGIAALLDFRNRRPLASNRAIVPRPAALGDIARKTLGDKISGDKTLSLRNIVLSFGNVRAIDGLDLDVKPGEVHGLIGPNGSGKTTTLNVISGYYAASTGTLALGAEALPAGKPEVRALRGIARTFQTPRVIGAASVLENVMIGGTVEGKATFIEALLALPRHWRDERRLAASARTLLGVVGLETLADVRADRLQHSELRFIEIARALMLDPDFLLLDEPAAGLSGDEIERLGGLIKAISRRGTAILLVEHHADLIFDICDQVTVLNLGRVLAAGTPAEIRVHKEVVSAYLGV
jgi:branched-chain amino acid transport system permease protein